MIRRRTLVATAVALLSIGTIGATTATADTAPAPDVRTASDDYIACAGVRAIDVATCIETPTGIIVDLLRNTP